MTLNESTPDLLILSPCLKDLLGRAVVVPNVRSHTNVATLN